MTRGPTLLHITAQARVLDDIVAALQPDAVPTSQAPALWSAFERIERLAAAAKILLARRVEDSKVWQREGHRSAVEYLAKCSGSSMAACRGALATSKRIPALPATEAALRSGALSASQAEAISDAAAHNPHAEHKLLETASHSSLAELRDECSRAKAAGDPDPDTTYRRIHENRYLRRRRDSEGAWNLLARGTPDAGAVFNAALDPIIDEIFHSAWDEGRREERQNYAFDALLELARRARNGDEPQGVDGHDTDTDTDPAEPPSGDSSQHAARVHDRDLDDRNDGQPGNESTGDTETAHRSDAAPPGDQGREPSCQQTSRTARAATARKPKTAKRRNPSNPTYLALLRIDFAALQRGHVDGDETCEIAGVGPIPVTRARQLLGDAVIKLIATKGKQVVNVTHYGRKPRTAQRMALLWSQPACTVQGCNQTFAQIDHRMEWHKTRHTRLDQLDRLCPHHHRLKTNQGWALTTGSGKRALVPPTDPRHPNQQPKPRHRAA